MFDLSIWPSHCLPLSGGRPSSLSAFDQSKLLGGARHSPQLPQSRPNRTDAPWTKQKRKRPIFERQSSQFRCLYYVCLPLLFAKTNCFLDLYSRIYADSTIYTRITQRGGQISTMPCTRRHYVRFHKTSRYNHTSFLIEFDFQH